MAENIDTNILKVDSVLPEIVAKVEVALPEMSISIDDMYASIGETILNLHNVTVDGEVPVSSKLQGAASKNLLPDTEMEMLHSNAVPLSADDINAFKERQKRMDSVAYRNSIATMPKKTLAEITGARVRIAYRLVRYMSHMRGIGDIGDPLIFSMASKNPQVNLFELPMPYNPAVGWYRGLAAARNLLAQAEEGPYEYSYFIDGQYCKTRGMSILPPPLHDGYYPPETQEKPLWQYRREGYIPEDYEGVGDAPLAIYLNICELLVRHLGIGNDDADEQAAVMALLNPKIARLAWPCKDDIETFEEYVLMPYIGRIVLSRSQEAAITHLRRGTKDEAGIGLTHSEAFDLIEAYKKYARLVNVYDPEMERSVMLGKLHRLADVCDDASAVTTQLNTFKTVSQILLLTKHEEDTIVDRRTVLSSALEDNMKKQIGLSEETPDEEKNIIER